MLNNYYIIQFYIYYGPSLQEARFAIPLALKLLEICAQNQGNAISEDPKFKNFPGKHAPGPTK